MGSFISSIFLRLYFFLLEYEELEDEEEDLELDDEDDDPPLLLELELSFYSFYSTSIYFRI